MLPSHGRRPTWRSGGTVVHDEPRTRCDLTEAESIRRLGCVSFGRVVFTQRALPVIRPVRHLVDDGSVIIRTYLGAAIRDMGGLVVAYQADTIDLDEHLGWSVTVVGIARYVSDPDDEARYAELLHPWISREMQHVIRITPGLITGHELDDDVLWRLWR